MNDSTTKEEVAFGRLMTFTRTLRTAFLTNIDNIPADLKSLKCWLVWKIPEINPLTGKFNKIPLCPRSGRPRKGKQGGKADLANLGTWEEACGALKADERIAGVGIALLPGFNIVALDVDNCIKDGKLREKVEQISDYTYCEISPSGKGVRALWRGIAHDGKNHADGFELFHSTGFVTITGNQVENCHTLYEARGALLPTLGSDLKAQLENYACAHGKSAMTDTPKETASSNAAVCEKVSSETITDLRSALRFMCSDDRERWQRMGHCLKTLGDVGRALFMEWSATSDKFNALADAKTWESFKPVRTSWRGVFSEAQRLGWVNPMSYAIQGSISGPWGDLQGIDEASCIQ